MRILSRSGSTVILVDHLGRVWLTKRKKRRHDNTGRRPENPNFCGKRVMYIPIKRLKSLEIMEKIPTAEEFAREEYDDDGDINIFMERQIDMKHAIWMMNIHAKRHVEAALKAAAKNTRLIGYGAHMPNKTDSQDSVYVVDDNGPDFIYSVDKKSILTAYPPENIK